MHGDRHSVFRRYLRVSRSGLCAMALCAALSFAPGDAAAARGGQERIEGFGPFTIGMARDKARAANPRAKEQDCGEIADGRRCIALKAAVFEEPAVIFAVLDEPAGKVERIVAELAPELTRRRGFRCVRLAEKVFALLVVVYGPDYKQSYDEDRRPLPAVAWDGHLEGRLVFEAKCKTSDEGKPRITVIEYYPDGVKPPPVARETPPAPVAEATQATPGASTDTAADAGEAIAIAPTIAQSAAPSESPPDLTLAPADGEAPVPLSAPVGAVEQIAPGAPDTSGSTDANAALSALTRELRIARSTPEAAPESAPPASAQTPQGSSPARIASPGEAGRAASAPASPVPPTQSAPQQAVPLSEGRGSPTIAIDVSPPAADATVAEPDSRDLRAPAGAPRSGPPSAVPSPAEDRPVLSETPPGPAPTALVAGRVKSEAPDATAAPATVAAQKPAAEAALTYRRPVPVVGPTVRPPSYGDAAAYPLPTDLEAPEPFMVPEEEELFRQRREAANEQPAPPTNPTLTAEVERRLASGPATPPPQANEAARAPVSLFSSSPGRAERRIARSAPAAPSAPEVPERALAPVPDAADRRTVAAAPADRQPAPEALSAPVAESGRDLAAPEKMSGDARQSSAFPGGWGDAKRSGFKPVETGGWRRSAPVPPAKPWRVRETSAPATERGA